MLSPSPRPARLFIHRYLSNWQADSCTGLLFSQGSAGPCAVGRAMQYTVAPPFGSMLHCKINCRGHRQGLSNTIQDPVEFLKTVVADEQLTLAAASLLDAHLGAQTF